MSTIFPKIFRSGDAGAPTLNGNAGSLITLLDACLINGYNSKSGLAIERSGTTATATYSDHGFARDQILVISGANETEYNTEVRVLSVTTNTFTFYMPETAAASTTGTVVAKVAPLGWEKTFSGTNKAVYRSTDVTSNRLYLRVIDDGTAYSTYAGRYAEVRCFEECADINTYYGPTPRYDNSYAYPWVQKLYYSTAVGTSVAWSLLGDSKIFYLLDSWYEAPVSWSTTGAPSLTCFGDIVSNRPGDSYNTVMIPGCSANTASPTVNNFTYDWTGILSQNATTYTFGYSCIARAYNQISQGTGVAFVINTPASRGLGANGIAFPNPVDGSLIYSEVSVVEEGYFTRGKLPGFYCPGHNVPLASPHTLTQQGVVMRNVGAENKTYFIAPFRVASTTSNNGGQLMIDLTGPWRS